MLDIDKDFMWSSLVLEQLLSSNTNSTLPRRLFMQSSQHYLQNRRTPPSITFKTVAPLPALPSKPSYPSQHCKTAATMKTSKHKIQNSGQILKFLCSAAGSNSTSYHLFTVCTFQRCTLSPACFYQKDERALPENLVSAL
jgi:hypothetical protein